MNTREHNEALIRIASYTSVAVAIVLIAMKLFAWWMTNSVSLQASLIDSFLDMLASLINVIAIRHALRPADKKHRYGHGKAESLAGLGQSIFIGASSLWLLYEVYDRFIHPEQIVDTGIGIMVMVAAIAITVALVIFQNFVVRKTRSTAIEADMLHYKSDVLINGAVIVSLVASHFLATDVLDIVIGSFIGLYVLWTAWRILVKATSILMDSELSDDEREKIIQAALKHQEIKAVESLRTRHVGLENFIEIQLVLDGDLSLNKAHRIECEVKSNICTEIPNSQIIVRLLPNSDEHSLKYC